MIKKSLNGIVPPDQLEEVARKWAKALNLSRIYQKDKNAKVLVYCSKSNLLQKFRVMPIYHHKIYATPTIKVNSDFGYYFDHAMVILSC